VLRTGRKGLAAGTLILDGAKGAAAVLLARHFVPELGQDGAMIAGAAAMIGHCYPVWLKFRGGKGVATLLGLSFALAWPIGLVFAVAWLGTVLLARISSLGGMMGAVSAPVAALAFGYPVYAIGLVENTGSSRAQMEMTLRRLVEVERKRPAVLRARCVRGATIIGAE
jgi:glycerol-3-phosphate acyltransferase PlsY